MKNSFNSMNELVLSNFRKDYSWIISILKRKLESQEAINQGLGGLSRLVIKIPRNLF